MPHAHERRFDGTADRLRTAERVARLEVERVTSLSLENVGAERILDVGTGTGVFAEAFAKSVQHISGIDVTPEYLETARGHVPNGEFVVGCAEDLPFADSFFDLVFFGVVLHETDDALKALQEAHRVSRKRVVVLEWPYRREEHGPPLEHRLPAARIEELARAAGFRAIEGIALARMDLYRLGK